MPAELLVPLIRSRELVLGSDLPGETKRSALYVLVFNARRTVRVERIRNDGVGALVSGRCQEPQFVPQNGSADGAVVVLDEFDLALADQTPGRQVRSDIGCLPEIGAAASTDEHIAVKSISTVFGNLIDQHSSGRDLRRDSGSLIRR